MHRQPLFVVLFALLVLIAILHTAATTLFLYWIYPWFDNMMHFLGGLLVGLSALWLVFQSRYMPSAWKHYSPVLVVGVAIIGVGISWEVFEYVIKSSIQPNFISDTASDLIMDALGALAGYLVVTRLYGDSYE